MGQPMGRGGENDDIGAVCLCVFHFNRHDNQIILVTERRILSSIMYSMSLAFSAFIIVLEQKIIFSFFRICLDFFHTPMASGTFSGNVSNFYRNSPKILIALNVNKSIVLVRSNENGSTCPRGVRFGFS